MIIIGIAVRIRILDENGNSAPYAQYPLVFETTGPIEIAGPSAAVLEGGMSGLYIRTTGETGHAELTIRCADLEVQNISFEVR